MQSVRRGLREGDINRGTYERLWCTECEIELRTIDDPDTLGTVKACPECGTRWEQL